MTNQNTSKLKTPIMTTIQAMGGVLVAVGGAIFNSTPGAIVGLALILLAIFFVLKDMASS